MIGFTVFFYLSSEPFESIFRWSKYLFRSPFSTIFRQGFILRQRGSIKISIFSIFQIFIRKYKSFASSGSDKALI